MKDMTTSINTPRTAGRSGLALIIVLAAAIFASPAHAGDAPEASKIKVEETAALEEIRVVSESVSANDARRAAYRYLADQGFSKRSGLGAVRVRSTTREGDTWVLSVSYSRTGRALSQQAMLFVDAESALVSEVAPEDIEGRVAAR